MTDPLSASGISKSFAGVPVLQDVDLALRAGEVHALVGENGAGKSTLIRILTGALRPDRGSVTLLGKPLPTDPREARRRGISCVYQEFTLVPDMTVRDNILLGRERGQILRARGTDDALTGRLRELGAHCGPDAIVRTLSVAEQQLVEIARALDTQAGVLILDEPTAALSGPEVERLL